LTGFELQVIHCEVFAYKLPAGLDSSNPELGLTSFFIFLKTAFDLFTNWLRQPGDFSIAAHTFVSVWGNFFLFLL
jgi:hypothetical protein